jgi:serine protease Do
MRFSDPGARVPVRAFATSLCAVVALTIAQPASAVAADARSSLHQLSDSVEAIVKRVSSSVVHIAVSGLTEVDDRDRSDADVAVERSRSVASGVIVDPNGYIMTNAHALKGALRVEVILPPQRGDAHGESRGETFDAHLVGIAPAMDLALLKIDAKDLPALSFADYDNLHQGQLVFAFGSPEGLRNSVTMGVVSAVARQTDLDDPVPYIQTDAPINPGNSGGPLVNADGDIVGINTFILSESGGSEGLGFAIPSAIVKVVYEQLKEHGRLRRGTMGVHFQTITRELATGLRLPSDQGVIVGDVLPGSPAEAAGLRVSDIVTSVDGRPVDGLFQLLIDSFGYRDGHTLTLNVVRTGEGVVVHVPVTEIEDDAKPDFEHVNPDDGLVRRLGVFGITVDGPAASRDLRIPHGVFVAARVGRRGQDGPLAAGDVIHTLNGVAVHNVRDLRTLLAGVDARSPVVLQVERHAGLSFVTLHID